uniref:pentatricopeptide repeat-containing protein At3g49740 n=1 Tax=Erigeron canadensis TaxID=72917 RepID=UPI001CB8EC81|nr:pentatricopeptide repeat-containing protein At3g49740 [Erigeron canadensis]XP_043618378.1 pentatricopeptide repeat-containing protein At3g49740 [Erigeron canadensis]
MTSELIKFNCLLTNLTKSQQYTKTLKLFQKIQSSQHLKPDQYTLSTTLTAIAHLRVPATGYQLHSYVIRTGYKKFPHVSNTLLFMYSKTQDLTSVKKVFNEINKPDVYSWTTLLSACTNLGDVDYACQLLDEIPERNEAAWNAVITGCVDNGYAFVGLNVFKRMHMVGIKHDNYSFASVLSLCCLEELVDFGKQVHPLVVKTGVLVKASVLNALISMYFNVGDDVRAFKVFEESGDMVHDEITYNSMIAGLVSLGRYEDGFVMFKKMQEVGLGPTERTFVSVMSSCVFGITAIQVHAHAIKTGFEEFSSVSNAAITMYSSCKDLQAAQLIFKGLEEKDRVSWNTMITSYAQESLFTDANLAYLQMQRQGIEPDEFTIGSLLATVDSVVSIKMILAIVIKNGIKSKTEVSNALISAFSKYNAIEDAYRIFSESELKNLISWNSMISGFHLNGYLLHGLDLFSEMLVSSVTPDVCTLSIALNICAGVSNFKNGKEIHGYILKCPHFHETLLGNALIALYAKCGVIDWSQKVFEMMMYKDVVSWNSIISALGQHGRGEEALWCFESMQKSRVKVEPDHTTFTAALTACSHAGLVDAGVEIFNSMVNKYGLEPGIDHFSCVVDLVGRAGYLDAAENLIKSDGFKVHSSVWWTLLSSCATHGDLRLGKIVAGFLLKTEEDKSGVYVVLANILANGGHWEEAENVRKMMRNCGVVKQPGYSLIRS